MFYTSEEASKLFNVSRRTISNWCDTLEIRKVKGFYKIDRNDLLLLAQEFQPETLSIIERVVGEESKGSNEETHQDRLRRAIDLITLEAGKKGVIYRVFTDEEYQDLAASLEKVEYQEEQIQYLRQRIEKQDEILQKLAQQLSDQIKINEQRNFIEAKDKGYNPD